MPKLPFLSLVIFLPIVASLAVLFFNETRTKAIRLFSIAICAIELLLVVYLYTGFNITAAGYQFFEKYDWVTLDLGGLGKLSIDYCLGLDGVSLSLLLLSSIVFLVSALASNVITEKQKGYYSVFLLLCGTINGCFLALDFFLFYLFFEFMLLPMYFLIGVWGGPRREYAAIKFFLYTLAGSVFILIAMIGLYLSVKDPAETALLPSAEQIVHTFRIDLMAQPANFLNGTFLHPDYPGNFWGFTYREWAFWLLLLGFIIKLPSVPFHTWLPDAHVEAPTPVSVILASVLLKIGGYGLYRIVYPVFPTEAVHFAPAVGFLGVVSIIYAAYNALAQSDLKKMIAYSSVSHMGFVLLGLASISIEGVNGAVYQMISHGFISAALFLIAGVIYHRTHDRTIQNYVGLANNMPRFTAIVTITFFASLGLPGFSGFVAEVLVFLGAFKSAFIPHWFAVLSTFGLVLAAGYYLWTLQRMFFGKFWIKPGLVEGDTMKDISLLELCTFVPLVIFIVLLGIVPSLLTDLIYTSVALFFKR